MRPGDNATKRSWSTMSQSHGTVPSESEFRYLKRSKTSPPKNSSKFMITIDDLPDHVLFEILLRLPLKSATQCKCVSKHWFALISSHYFLSRFHGLCLQYDSQMQRTLIFWDTTNQTKFFSISELSMLKRGRFSLNFLPRYQSAAKEKVIAWRPVVVGAYNDLVLCCATTYSQRDYFICNPYTKQWVALPPVPDCRFVVRVGFICEPFYYCNRREENNSTSTGNIQLNVNYKYAIVILLKPYLHSPRTCSKLEVQIFSSETGKWTESVVLSPRSFCFDDLVRNPGLAYKGMLYWWTECDGYMIGLDPFSNNNRQFHIIDFPVGEPGSVSVSRGGRLRMYEVSNGWVETRRFRDEHVVNVWELKDEDDDKVDGRRVGKWCLLSTVPLDRMVLENPLSSPSRWSKKKAVGLAFDPNNDDILYLAFYDVKKGVVYRSIVACNISAKTFKQATTPRMISDNPFNIPFIGVISFMVPWLPTPVPRLEYNHKDMHAAHFSTCGWCYGRRARGVRYE